MHLFSCDVCHEHLYFESSSCTKCSSALGFVDDLGILSALRPLPDRDAVYEALAPEALGRRVRYCEKAQGGACNWLVAEGGEALCTSCRLSEVIPDVGVESTFQAWKEMENAKRRLLFTLHALGLPIESRQERPNGLAFHLLKPTPERPVMTGHSEGIITLNVDEAHTVFRENQREFFSESYRTPLGHFRHESGHYYFARLLLGSPRLEEFRALFGDEREPYPEALERHHKEGPPSSWSNQFVSAYATMHPWEDWAETWAHYLHMVDTLDTAESYAMAIRVPDGPSAAPGAPGGQGQVSETGGIQSPAPQNRLIESPAVRESSFDELVGAWIPLTLALNSLNRSMGLRDAYPFSLSDAVQAKLRFIHKIIRDAAQALSQVTPEES